MPGLEASGAPLHAATLLSTARAEHRGGKSRLARWELLTARVLCLFAGTTGVYPRAYRKGTRSRVRHWASCQMPMVLHIMPKRVSAHYAAIMLEACAHFMPDYAENF